MRGEKTSDKRFRKFMLFVLVVGLGFLGLRGQEMYQLHCKQQEVKQQIARLEQEQQELLQERERLQDPRYVEKLAREKFNMVGKNEVPLSIIEQKE